MSLDSAFYFKRFDGRFQYATGFEINLRIESEKSRIIRDIFVSQAGSEQDFNFKGFHPLFFFIVLSYFLLLLHFTIVQGVLQSLFITVVVTLYLLPSLLSTK